jgi:hypothetical protein
VGDFPVSQFALGLVSILVAMEAAVNVTLIAAWATVGIVALGELLWKKLPWTRTWRLSSKIASCVIISFVVYSTCFFQYMRPNVVFQIGEGMPFIGPATDGSLWIRIGAFNRGWRDLTCRFYLNSLEKDGIAAPLIKNEYIQLLPAGGQDYVGNSSDIVIPSDQPRYFNLAYIQKGADELSIQPPQFHNEYAGKLTAGLYRFMVSASSGACQSGQHMIVIRYRGGKEVSIIQAPN